jgi:hypothetical protein
MLPLLLVVNYPTISKEDFEWIQHLRREHDRLNFSAIDPHFTLVFLIDDIDPEQLVSHIRQSVRDVESFEFVIRCAVLANDAFEIFNDGLKNDRALLSNHSFEIKSPAFKQK